MDSLTGWPGNLGEIIEWNTSTDLESAGFGRAVEVFARATSWSQVASPRLPEVFNVLPDPLPGGTLPGLLLVALAAAAVVAVRRGLGAELWLLGVVGATWLGGFVAITNSRGPQFVWFFGWIPPLVWMSWAAVAIIGWRVVDLPDASANGTGRHRWWPGCSPRCSSSPSCERWISAIRGAGAALRPGRRRRRRRDVGVGRAAARS
ncbi:MAG: hypothetical protein WKF58_08275 [Ilumatobacteraceae bacterium]